MSDEQNENRVLLVGYKSKRPSIAGALAWMIRNDSGRAVILKTSNSSEGIANAVRAIILAQKFLNDPRFPGNTTKVRLSVTISEDKQNQKNGVMFVVRCWPRRGQ